nr:PKD domain-containing protein [Acanthopleuribacter pedis]
MWVRVRTTPPRTGKRAGKGADDIIITPWANGILYYRFADDVTGVQAEIFDEAVQAWDALDNLQVVRNGANDPRPTNYVEVRNSLNGNNSVLGMAGGKQILNLQHWDPSVILHEVGHALGLLHEQQRGDRDTFVTVTMSNVKPDKRDNFTRIDGVTQYGAYDFASIMHYHAHAFSKNGLPVMAPTPDYADQADVMGRLNNLSAQDIAEIEQRYQGLAAPITIADANLRAVLTALVDYDENDVITVSEAGSLTGILNLKDRNIADVTGIEAFTSVAGLDLQGNQLSSLPDLSAMTRLGYLNLNGNQFTEIPTPAPTLPLDVLFIQSNPLGADACAQVDALRQRGLKVLDTNPLADGGSLDCGNAAPALRDILVPDNLVAGVAGSYRLDLSDTDNDRLFVHWDFGDNGKPVSGHQVHHAYAAAGTYTIRVRVADRFGGLSELTRDVVVATELNQPYVVVGKALGRPNDLVSLPLFFGHMESAVALQCDLVYDAGRLSGEQVLAETGLAPHEFHLGFPQPGRARLTIFDVADNDALQQGRLVHVPLRVSADAAIGFVAVRLENVFVVSAQAAHVAVGDLVQGVVQVIRPENQAPRIFDYNLNLPTSYRAYESDIAAYDLDGDNFLFEIVDGPILGTAEIDPLTGAMRYTPNPGSSGNDQFTFRVFDGLVYSRTATYDIALERGSAPPVIERLNIPDQGYVGVPLPFSADFHDPDGDDLHILWNFGEGAGGGNDAAPTATYTEAGIYTVSLELSDGTTQVRRETQIEILPNSAPDFVSVGIPVQGLLFNEVTFSSSVADADGDPVTVTWTLDDGVVLEGEVVSHAYQTAGTRGIQVTVRDDKGAENTRTGTISITSVLPPEIYSIHVPPTGSVDVPVTFWVGAGDYNHNINQMRWTFGDGTGASGYRVTHSYTSAGTYPITLRVIDSGNLETRYDGEIVIGDNAAPVIHFVNGPDSLALNSTGTFAVVAEDPDGEPLTLSWDMGDGTNRVGERISHAYTGAGERTITVTAADPRGVTTQASKTVIVGDNNAPEIQDVQLAALRSQHHLFDFAVTASDADGDTLSYHWDFGNGESASTPSGSILARDLGIFHVVVTVTDSRGAASTHAQWLEIVDNDSPTYAWTAVPNKAIAGLETHFLAQAKDNEGDAITYLWTMAGQTREGRAVSFTFPEDGSQTVTLRLQDDRGAAVARNFSVTVGAEAAPALRDLTLPATAILNRPVDFAVDAVDPDGGALSYGWTLGSTEAGDQAAFQHTFTAFGAVNVTLVVSDNAGNETRVNAYGAFDAHYEPVIDRFVVPEQVKVGEAFSVSSNADDPENDTLTYTWDFGDGSPEVRQQSPSHTFTETGQYLVTLTVTDNRGARVLRVQQVTVYDNLPPQITTLTVPGEGRVDVALTMAATIQDIEDDAFTTSWDFGDGTAAVGGNPVEHAYAAPGVYTVTLTVTDARGAVNQQSADVEIFAYPVIENVDVPLIVTRDQLVPMSVDAYNPSGGALTYVWNFGDGAEPVNGGNSVSHTFTELGLRLPVRVTVSNGVRESSATVYVAVLGPDAEAIAFADAGFKAAMVAQFDGNNDGEISYAEAAAVHGDVIVSSISGSDISLGGLEAFIHITGFRARYSRVRTVPHLSHLVHLTDIDLRSNNVRTMGTLPVNLTHLNVERNDLYSLPLLPTTLTWLDCSNNNIRAGFGRGRIPASLNYLDCSNNSDSRSSTRFNLMLREATGLRTLIAKTNHIDNRYFELPDGLENLTITHTATIETVSGLPDSIINLDLGYNPEITSIDRLPANLEVFDFGGHNIHFSGYKLASIGDLSHVTKLRELVLPNMDLTTLNGISGMASLVRLDVGGNDIAGTIEDLDGLSALTQIDLGGNAITALGRLPDGLESLDVNHNQLADLPDLAGLTALRTLRVGGNQLSHIADLANLVQLTYLDLSANQFATLPELPRAGTLVTLNVQGNQLTELPELTGLERLTSVNAAENQLAILPDLALLTGLTTLDVHDNQLSAVPDFSGFANLRTLNFSGNLLGLDDCPAIAAARGVVQNNMTVNPLKDGSDLDCPNTAPRILSLNVPATGSYDTRVTMSATVEDDEFDRVTLYWDFGNAQSGQAYSYETVDVTYATTGTYQVSVRAVDARGLETLAHTQIVIGSQAPRVTRYGIPSQVFADTNTPFSIEGEDPEGDPITFSWDFGDGSAPVIGANVNHRYTETGTFTVTVTLDDGNGGIATFTREVEVLAQNRYPDIQNVSFPSSAVVNTSVTFTAEATDPDGDAITFTWAFGDGATATGAEVNHTYDAIGDYSVRLVVRDRWGYGRSTGGTIRISAANANPAFGAVSVPTTALVGESLAMSAVVSDPDGDPLTVTWTLGDGNQRQGTAVQHSYSAAGAYIVTIQVSDGRGGSATTVRNVNVTEPDNRQPEITALTVPATGNPGEAVSFSVSASDPDGDPLTYSWNFGDGSATAASASVSHTFAAAGDYTVNVTVADDRGAQVVSGGVIRIQSDIQITDLTVPISVNGLTAAADGALYFRLQAEENLSRLVLQLAGGNGNADLYLLEGETPTPANFDFVSDDVANSESIEVPSPAGKTWYLLVHAAEAFSDAVLTVSGDLENRAPHITELALPNGGSVGQSLSFSVTAADPDGDDLQVTWSFGDGSQANGAQVTHTYATAGTYDVQVNVLDGRGGQVGGNGQVIVQAAQGNQPPQISGVDYPGSAENGDPVTFTVTATDPNGDPLTYAWNFGDGSSAEGRSVTHTYATGGVYSVEVRVSDGRGGTGIATLQIQITEVPLLGIGDSIADLSGGAGAYLLHKIVAGPRVTELAVATSGGSGDMALFVRAGARPEGSNYDFVSWQTGNNEQVDITDPAGKTWYVVVYGVASFSNVTLQVSGREETGGNRAPNLGSLSLPERASVGETLTFSVQASDPDGDPLSVVWTTGDGTTLEGVQVNHAFAQPGTYTVTATVSDGRGGSDSATGSVTVTGGGSENGAPSITNGSVPTQAIVGVAADFQLEVSDPDGDPLTVTWAFGDGGGATGASVSHSFSSAGTFNWTVTVSDGRGGEVGANGSVTVVNGSAGNRAPQVTGMTFSAQTETDVATQFSATATDPDGDAMTYTWIFGDGGTAQGQTVDHTFSEGGTVSVEVRVSDGRGGTGTGRSTIQVEALPQIAVGQTQPGLNAAQNAMLFYKLVVPEGNDSVTVTLGEGSGDADLYIREGAKPTGSAFDFRSWNTGNNESIRIDSAGGKTWYLMIHAYEAVTGLTLSAQPN